MTFCDCKWTNKHDCFTFSSRITVVMNVHFTNQMKEDFITPYNLPSPYIMHFHSIRNFTEKSILVFFIFRQSSLNNSYFIRIKFYKTVQNFQILEYGIHVWRDIALTFVEHWMLLISCSTATVPTSSICRGFIIMRPWLGCSHFLLVMFTGPLRKFFNLQNSRSVVFWLRW